MVGDIITVFDKAESDYQRSTFVDCTRADSESLPPWAKRGIEFVKRNGGKVNPTDMILRRRNNYHVTVMKERLFELAYGR